MIAARQPKVSSFLLCLRERKAAVVSLALDGRTYQRKQLTNSTNGVSLLTGPGDFAGVGPFDEADPPVCRPNSESLGSPVRSGRPSMLRGISVKVRNQRSEWRLITSPAKALAGEEDENTVR